MTTPSPPTGRTTLETVYEAVPCTVCGCVCGDLRLRVVDGALTGVEGACRLAAPWFASVAQARWLGCEIQGASVSLSVALDRAAELLLAARLPLIYGLSRSTTEAQRAAVALADQLRGTIDTTAGTGHGPSIVALQEVGEVTCTLGEVKNRADVVLFWNSDPVTTHPRHLERYAGDPVGRFVPQGRAGRTIIVVDHKRTATADLADHFFEVSGEESWEMLWRLRLLVRGGPVAAAPEWVALAERLKLAQCGILFFGKGLTEGPMGHRHVAALLELVTDLNRYTRFYARRMRRYGDVAGADSVLAWQTGYPFGVDFSRGYPRYNPGEFTGVDRLSRAEVDAALILSRETVADLPWPARDTLQRIPTILLDPFPVPPEADWRPTVHIPTALYGIHRPGTAYRMDEVPIPLPEILPSDLPSDAEILMELLHRLSPECP